MSRYLEREFDRVLGFSASAPVNAGKGIDTATRRQMFLNYMAGAAGYLNVIRSAIKSGARGEELSALTEELDIEIREAAQVSLEKSGLHPSQYPGDSEREAKVKGLKSDIESLMRLLDKMVLDRGGKLSPDSGSHPGSVHHGSRFSEGVDIETGFPIVTDPATLDRLSPGQSVIVPSPIGGPRTVVRRLADGSFEYLAIPDGVPYSRVRQNPNLFGLLESLSDGTTRIARGTTGEDPDDQDELGDILDDLDDEQEDREDRALEAIADKTDEELHILPSDPSGIRHYLAFAGEYLEEADFLKKSGELGARDPGRLRGDFVPCGIVFAKDGSPWERELHRIKLDGETPFYSFLHRPVKVGTSPDDSGPQPGNAA